MEWLLVFHSIDFLLFFPYPELTLIKMNEDQRMSFVEMIHDLILQNLRYSSEGEG